MLDLKPEKPMPVLDPDEKRELLDGATLARRLFPGAIGDLVFRELTDAREFGYRVGAGALSRRLLAALEDEQRRRGRCTCR